MVSKGSIRLTQILKEKSQHDIAEQLAVAQSAVSRWATGKQSPMGALRARIEDSLGIPWRWWDEPSDQADEAAPDSPTAAE